MKIKFYYVEMPGPSIFAEGFFYFLKSHPLQSFWSIFERKLPLSYIQIIHNCLIQLSLSPLVHLMRILFGMARLARTQSIYKTQFTLKWLKCSRISEIAAKSELTSICYESPECRLSFLNFFLSQTRMTQRS